MSTRSEGGAAAAPGLPAAVPAGDLASLIPREIERLANAVLAQWPGAGPSRAAPEQAAPSVSSANVPRSADPTLFAGPGAQAAHVQALPLTAAEAGPPATATLAPLPPPRFGPSALNVGGGGASPAVVLPPIPGAIKDPPLATAPPPREADLRGLTALYAENVHGTSAVPLLSAVESAAPSASPYFLQGAERGDAPYFLPARLPTVPGISEASLAAPSPFQAIPLVEREGERAPPTSGEVPGATLREPPDLARWQARGADPSSPSIGAAAPMSLADVGPEPAGRDNAPAAHSPQAGYVPVLAEVPRAQPRLFDPYAIKEDFPILRERVHGKPLVWLDNGATTQKPSSVIDRISYFYEHENSNIHRAAHTLAARSTDAYEGARDKVHRFINTSSPREVVFTRGTTESINLVAQSWGRKNIGPGDEIVITWLEHHANIVPWQQLATEKGATLRVVPVDDRGQVLLDEYVKLLGPRTKLVAITQVSNALGTIVPVREMVQLARHYGATTLVDGAQAVSHMRVDVQQIGCDFYVFSGHKLFAPTGIGALYGRREVLEAMPPWQGGGNMIADVTFDKTVYQPPPMRFEAGTGNIADAVGLGAAIDYVNSIGIENVSVYEHQLLEYGTCRLAEVPGLRMIGTALDKAGVMSFVLDDVPTEQVGAALDRDGIAVRAGHHCAQPILRRFGVEATVRATLAPYNTREDLDTLVASLKRLVSARRPSRK